MKYEYVLVFLKKLLTEVLQLVGLKMLHLQKAKVKRFKLLKMVSPPMAV